MTGTPSPARTRGVRAPSARERGSVAIEYVLIMPVMVSMTFLGVQGALYYQARSVALAAAQEGARAASSLAGTEAEGRAQAAGFLAAAGGEDVITGAEVASSRTPQSATVTVSGSPLMLVPGLTLRVSQSATYPVERITG